MTHSHREDKAMGWIAGKITVDEGATIVDAEYRDDYRWNGWLCPRMKFDAAEQVLRAIAEESPEQYLIMLDGDTFVLYEFDYAEYDTAAGIGYEPEIIAPTEDGWYSPGYMGWCWEDASNIIGRFE